MLITRTITREVTDTIQVETPSFYKTEHNIYGVYSEKKVIQITNIGNGHAAISISELRFLYHRDDVFYYDRITQAEFETTLNETAQRITNLELEPA